MLPSIEHYNSMKKKCGQPQEYIWADMMYLKGLVMQTPSFNLWDLQKKHSHNQFIDLSELMIHQISDKECFSHKKAAKKAAEWNEEVAQFIYNISWYTTAQLSCLDETAKDERVYFKLYGRAPIGMPVEVVTPFVHGDQYTLQYFTRQHATPGNVPLQTGPHDCLPTLQKSETSLIYSSCANGFK